MIQYYSTLKEWENSGLLTNIPEERKQMMVNCFNSAIKWITSNSIVSDDVRLGEFETMILPVLYRIVKEVDLTEEKVFEVCREFRHSWLNFDPTNLVNIADPEQHFVKTYAEIKINQYKK
jgi:hypothetical protein